MTRMMQAEGRKITRRGGDNEPMATPQEVSLHRPLKSGGLRTNPTPVSPPDAGKR
jgi:hypothetical protein